MDLSQQAARGQPGRSSRFWLVDHLRWKEWVHGKLLGSTRLWHTVHYGYLFSWQLPVLLFSSLCSFWSQNTLTSACLSFTGPQSWLLSVCPLQGLCFLSLKDMSPHLVISLYWTPPLPAWCLYFSASLRHFSLPFDVWNFMEKRALDKSGWAGKVGFHDKDFNS